MSEVIERCPDCGYPMVNGVCQHCKIERYDNDEYLKFCNVSMIDKAINTLEGILIGISIDNILNPDEIKELKKWCSEHNFLLKMKPFDSLIKQTQAALADNVLTLEEKEDLLWLCERLHGDGLYYDAVTCGLQKLEGILHGILADGHISKEELIGLESWLGDNEQLSSFYPFDEIYALIASVLKDGIVTDEEEAMLKRYFSQFAEIDAKKCIDTNAILNEGICALAPNIEFKDHLFSFTGKSKQSSRAEIANVIKDHGGKFKDNVVEDTNYLVIGNDGNPCWAFACYGRKVEKAIEMRKNGSRILLINEVDFWDAL